MAYLDNVYAVVQIAPTGIPTYVRLSQNENGRVLNFAVSGDALPAGSTVALTGTKPDGAVYSASGTLADNVATFNEDEQLTAVAGEWDAKVEVTNSGNLIATGRIKFVIDADPSGGNIPSDSQLDGYIAEMLSMLDAGKAEAYGSPLVASTVAGMTDQSRVYVYTGSETGYTAGNWYYWNGSSWTSGGVYNAVAVSTDTTLSIAGKAADAKATGDALDELKDDLSDIFSSGINLYDKEKLTSGHYIVWNTGNIGETGSYGYTDYIELEAGKYYTISITDQTCIYDDNKQYIGGFYIQANGNINISENFPPYTEWMSNYTVLEKPVTILAQPGWKFMRQSLRLPLANALMVSQSQNSLPYFPYTIIKNNLAVSAGDIYGFSLTDIGKTFAYLLRNQPRIKFIGDSITAGFGGTGYNDTAAGGGELVVSFGGGVYSNVQGHCWVNSIKAYWEEKFGCTVKNFGWTGAASARIIEYWTQLVNAYDDIIVCMIGTNDRGQHESVQGLIDNLETIYLNSVKLGKPIIFMASIPASVNNETSGNKYFHMEDVEHAIRYITDLHNIPFINLYQMFMDYCLYTGVTIDSLLSDGLHPNDIGYDVIFNLISKATNISTKRPDATW